MRNSVKPPFIYGPFVKGTKIPKGRLETYSTAGAFYRNLFPVGGSAIRLKPIQESAPLTVDVRDVAKAHVIALTSPPSSEVGRKRLIIAGRGFFWKEAVDHLRVVRSGLKDRLPDPSEAQFLDVVTLDVSRAREVLGLTEYVDWKKTVEDCADSLLEIEASW